jgi:hypothetical protein
VAARNEADAVSFGQYRRSALLLGLFALSLDGGNVGRANMGRVRRWFREECSSPKEFYGTPCLRDPKAKKGFAWRTIGLAAMGLLLIGADDPDQSLIYCNSLVNKAYTGTPRTVSYYAFVEVKDAEAAGLKSPIGTPDGVVQTNFASWIRATGQFGRWNSISKDEIDCRRTDPEARIRVNDPPRDEYTYEAREARLPPDWYKRSASTASPAELARYSTGAPPPGLDRPNNAALTIPPSTPTVQDGWDQAVRDQLRRDAAARAKSIAETARADARNQAQMDKFLAEMKKRGSAQ